MRQMFAIEPLLDIDFCEAACSITPTNNDYNSNSIKNRSISCSSTHAVCVEIFACFILLVIVSK